MKQCKEGLTFLCLVLSLFRIENYSQTQQQIILSEIMFKPVTGNNEFVEIYNCSETQTININGYKIQYDQNDAELFTSNNGSYDMVPGSFAIILEKDYDFDAGIYAGIIPTGTLILSLEDNAFGRSGLSNSSDKTIKLIDSNDLVIAEYIYTANNDYGISDEKILLDNNDDPSNWLNSISVNGTPGSINSVSPKINDLCIENFYSIPGYGLIGEEIKLIVKLKNNGIVPADLVVLKVCNDVNEDSVCTAGEIIFDNNYQNLLPGDSLVIEFSTTEFMSGNNHFIASVEFIDDEYFADNTAYLNFPGIVINEVRGDVIVNEFMYTPENDEPEWIELYNISDKEINLLGYQIADNSSTSVVVSDNVIMMPGEFIVIAKDSSLLSKYEFGGIAVIVSFPALNNSGDTIVMLDSLNRVIDSLEYNASWGGAKGKSLERIDPRGVSTDASNWEECKNIIGGTPGEINSVTQKEYDLKITKVWCNPEHPVKGDNTWLNVELKNIGTKEIEYTILLYETNMGSSPLEISALFVINPSDSISYQFNYTIANIDETRNFTVSIYAEEDQDTSNNIMTYVLRAGYPAGAMLINEVMYNPANDEPEWVEFYNVSDYQIDLSEWQLSDVITTPVRQSISNDKMIIDPGVYIVVAKDSMIYNYHRAIPSTLIVTGFANLNNDEDGIVLKDFSGFTIDSVFYDQSWGGIKGHSLERKSIITLSTEPDNWSVSTDLEQSTPGRINSITVKEYDLAVKSITSNPRFPVLNDEVYVNVVVKNLGQRQAYNFELSIHAIIDGVDIILSEFYGMELAPGDSSVAVTDHAVFLNEEILIWAELTYTEDLDLLNNYAELRITPGCTVSSVLINEIMYDPNEGEPEWVEFINKSEEAININHWSVSDILTTPTKNVITFEDYIIEPGDLFVLTSNKFFFDENSNVNCQVFEADFGSLSNTKDGIIIYDFRNAIIDSLIYESSWGGGNGRSLERLSLNSPTCDQSNWSTCLSLDGCTVGRINSIIQIEECNFGDIVINEIMYAPSDENSEYVEFYNRCSNSIEIGGWYLEDESGNKFKLSDRSNYLLPNEYFVIAADSSILTYYDLTNESAYVHVLGISNLSLSNNGENLKLKDLFGNVIDSLTYKNDWHNENLITTNNKSLEKINPGINGNDHYNWSTCVDELGGTPAAINSIYTRGINKNSSLSINPNPFSPDNDGYEDFAIINYTLTHSIAQLRIKVFDSKGRLVRELLNNQASGSSGSVIFDGLDDNGKPLKIGIYILFIEALNSSSGVVDILKDVVVIARKL